MPEFPRKEADVELLGGDILGALKDDFDGLHGAPVSAAELEALLNEFSQKSFAAMQARAEAKKLSGEKRADFNKLKNAIRQLLNYAESRNLTDAQLTRIGWAARHARRPASKPAQPLELVIVKEGADWLSLHWRNDRTGGKAKFYRIMRRGANNEFYEVASSLGTEHNLIDLPRGEQLEFRVVAVNKAGESTPSNSVHAVL